MTISIERELAEYVRTTPGISSTNAEAVELYRSRELEAQLEDAYRTDATESEHLDREWRSADAKVEE
jgi:hypothetical protein